MVGVLVAVAPAGGGEVCSLPGWLWQRGQKEIWGHGEENCRAGEKSRRWGHTWGGGLLRLVQGSRERLHNE